MSVTICYLIREKITNNYKIGQSNNVKVRFNSHITSNIHLELVGITIKAENDLHEEFDEFRIQGEWFDFSSCKENETRLLSYFIKHNSNNLKYINKKVAELRPNHVTTRKKKEIIKPEPEIIHVEREPIRTGREKSNHVYHMMMKYGGGRRW